MNSLCIILILSLHTEWLRPLARSASNAALFTTLKTDPALIHYENTHSNNNRMNVMTVLGSDCSSQENWREWLEKGKRALNAAKIPRMMISGDSDGTFSVEDVTKAKYLLEVPDECFLIVKDAGHLPMLEKPEEVAQAVKTFLCNHTTCLLCVKKTILSSKTGTECQDSSGGDGKSHAAGTGNNN